jgi:hypothetical protein
MNSSSGKGNLTEPSWGGTGFHGFGEVSQNIADWDEVDFGGAGLWNQVEFSWLAVAVSVVISPERRVLFYRLRGSRTGEWGVETKSQELKSRMNRLRIQCPLRKRSWKRAVLPYRILTSWPHWHTTKGVTHLSSYGYGLKRRLSWVRLSRCVKPSL